MNSIKKGLLCYHTNKMLCAEKTQSDSEFSTLNDINKMEWISQHFMNTVVENDVTNPKIITLTAVKLINGSQYFSINY